MDRIIDVFITSLAALVGSGIAYYFTFRSKLTDRNFKRDEILNELVSNMLDLVHVYELNKHLVNEFTDEKSDSFIKKLPLKLVERLIPGLEKGSYSDIENTIKSLKKYVPDLYFRLNGMAEHWENSLRVVPLIIESKDVTLAKTYSIAIQNNLDSIYESLDDALSYLSRSTRKNIKHQLKHYEGDSFWKEIKEKATDSLTEIGVTIMQKPIKEVNMVVEQLLSNPDFNNLAKKFEPLIIKFFEDPDFFSKSGKLYGVYDSINERRINKK
jgi:hypothetical protein